MKDYDKLPAFSSFLPGLTGVKGIPMWVFYTNRGQAINSFGIHNKNNAIMEFNPANTAYENTSLKGYRTFLRCNGEFFEPFGTNNSNVKRTMYLKKNSICIEEINEQYEIKIKVNYFVLPKDSIGALVRKVTIENIGNETKDIEVLDGLPKIIPYGIHNGSYKEVSNLLKSWTDIKNLDQGIPYYSMRASSDDTAEVSEVYGGYYYFTIMEEKVQKVIYDPDVVFDYDTSLQIPVTFRNEGLSGVERIPQYFVNKVPCGFTPAHKSLLAGSRLEFVTLCGYAESKDQVNAKAKELCKAGILDEKEIVADELMEEYMSDVKTKTANHLFDQYIEQCYLDNFLRGGYPYVMNEKSKNPSVIHLFSRKHGDPERDYNFFSIAGEYYSQGNGNFRDVCQNRRNDVFFQKEIDDFNIVNFFSLLQIDGYNPLEIRPSTFSIRKNEKENAKKLIHEVTGELEENLLKIIDSKFTPGQISNTIAREQIHLNRDEDDFLKELLLLCDQNMEAGFGEGYWSDHWGYLMDLVENYVMIYPERKEHLLYDSEKYRFYDSVGIVLPRSETYVIKNNQVRQYGSIVHDHKKLFREGFVERGTNWLKNCNGEIVTTTLFVKMIALSLIKFSTLDPYGMGIEMEGGKPGWNDAMNGLPGIFGSGMAETIELKRLIVFLVEELKGKNHSKEYVSMPVEIADFMLQLSTALSDCKTEGFSDFTYWDRVATLRENYREVTRYELSGEKSIVTTEQLISTFEAMYEKIEAGIEKAMEYGKGIMPTYFTYVASEFEPVIDQQGNPVISHYGLPKAKVKAFVLQMLPSFLEGPARMISTSKKNETLATMVKAMKESEVYDHKLKMYKTSESLENISMENGRIRAFTPGWLERESVFLHMEYKYFYGLLRAGFYEEYYEAIQDALIPFLDPKIYGRSILENSSFIASSVNPNPATHGRGYVARLSGSTTEVISMWIHMFVGEKGFIYKDNTLKLRFEPKLPNWLFDESNEVSFTFLSQCEVTYCNPERKNTYGENRAQINSIEIEEQGKGIQVIVGDTLCGEIASSIRDGKIEKIKVHMS